MFVYLHVTQPQDGLTIWNIVSTGYQLRRDDDERLYTLMGEHCFCNYLVCNLVAQIQGHCWKAEDTRSNIKDLFIGPDLYKILLFWKKDLYFERTKWDCCELHGGQETFILNRHFKTDLHGCPDSLATFPGFQWLTLIFKGWPLFWNETPRLVRELHYMQSRLAFMYWEDTDQYNWLLDGTF